MKTFEIIIAVVIFAYLFFTNGFMFSETDHVFSESGESDDFIPFYTKWFTTVNECEDLLIGKVLMCITCFIPSIIAGVSWMKFHLSKKEELA